MLKKMNNSEINNKNNNKIKIIKKILLSFFIIGPLFCVFLDLICSTALWELDKEFDGTKTIHFDISLVNQVIYFSVWNDLILAVWAMTYFSNISILESTSWSKKKSNMIIVAGYSFLVLFLFGSTMIAGYKENIHDFNCWYKGLKSGLEHFIIPISFMLSFLFLFNEEKTDVNVFFKQKSWRSLMIPIIYVIFIIFRMFMIVKFSPDINSDLPVFPYDIASPRRGNFGKSIMFLFVFLILCWSFTILFIFLSNSVIKWKENRNSPKKVDDSNPLN